jgi:hypothetical protein
MPHMEKQGFGGTAPSKLKLSAEGREVNKVSKPCQRHGLKLVALNGPKYFEIVPNRDLSQIAINATDLVIKRE